MRRDRETRLLIDGFHAFERMDAVRRRRQPDANGRLRFPDWAYRIELANYYADPARCSKGCRFPPADDSAHQRQVVT